MGNFVSMGVLFRNQHAPRLSRPQPILQPLSFGESKLASMRYWTRRSGLRILPNLPNAGKDVGRNPATIQT